jgi:hypothetical protein
VADLLRFAQALNSGSLISQAMLDEATRPHQQHYGYGFTTEGEGLLSSYGHSGGAPGMNGELRPGFRSSLLLKVPGYGG